MDRERNGNEHYVVLADVDFLERLEEENAQLRREVDALWNFLFQAFEGRFETSTN